MQEAVIPTTGANDINLPQAVRAAAALGWGIAELLGRCYSLKEAPPTESDWSGDKLIRFQEVYTPREKLRALIVYIRFLADSLSVSSCVLNDEYDPDNAKPYIEVLEEEVRLLTQHNLDPAKGATLRGKINEHLFFWDLNILDTLQGRATAIPKSYLVGRSLAGLRWYLGIPDKTPDDDFMKKIYSDYLPLLQPYISPFASSSLSNSFVPWWNAISSGQVHPLPGEDPPLELQKQADIWFSLVTNEREALSYVPASAENRGYLLKVLQVFWPFLAGGIVVLVLIVALLVFLIVSNLNIVNKEITAVIGLLAAFGITHSLVNTIGGILQKAISEVTGTFRGSVIDNIKHSMQQQAVNQATFIPLATVSQQLAQNPQVKR
jgi:hypothetical protein